MRMLLPIVIFFTLFACDRPNTRVDRLENFEQSLRAMDCDELKKEAKFQQNIAQGILKRQDSDVTLADIGATALSLGYNLIENTAQSSSRNSRLEELQQKRQMIILTRQRKECPS